MKYLRQVFDFGFVLMVFVVLAAILGAVFDARRK